MQTDLDRGAVLVTAVTQKGQTRSWWRIDPSTGETVGQIGDGRGAEVSEYLQGAALAVSITLLAVSLVDCGRQANPETLADEEAEMIEAVCCGVFAAVWFAVGLYIGSLFRTLGGAAWDLGSSAFPSCQRRPQT